MRCIRCNIEFNTQNNTCPSCGTFCGVVNENNLNNMNYNQPNYNNIQTNQQTIQDIPIYDTNVNNMNVNSNIQNVVKSKCMNMKNRKTIAIVFLLLIIIGISGILIFIGKNKQNPNEILNDGSRTIMIYLAPANLESTAGIATSDLAAINPDKIDLEKTNVLVYTAGTKRWANFIKSDENAIYKLEKDGFEKIESYDKKSAGDYETFLSFLNYSYDNYKTEYYDLVMYNHGGGIDGAIYDELSNEHLELTDFKKAFEESRFNSENKLNTITFRTCLNGTLEVANVLSPYVKYLIASEEVTLGQATADVFSYINNLSTEDDEVQYGKKFIEAYQKQIEIIDPGNKYGHAYSIIDLSKINDINNELSEFISKIDVQSNYIQIARIRKSLYQYGDDSSCYDMIDLSSLVNKLHEKLNINANSLLEKIDEAVVYNWADIPDTTGLSIYFPYKGKEDDVDKFFDIYEDIEFNEEYSNFLKKFNVIQNGEKIFSFNVKDNVSTFEKNGEDSIIKMQLSSEQTNNYANSLYMIFEKQTNGSYRPIFSSDDVSIDEQGIVSAKLSNKLIMYKDEEGKYYYLPVINRNKGGNSTYKSTAMLTWTSESWDEYDNRIESADVYFDFDDKMQPYPSIYKKIGEGTIPNGAILTPKNYDWIYYASYTYKILDSAGNYNENWEIVDYTRIETKMDEQSYKLGSLESGEYYYIFKVYDIQGNYSYSKLSKVGE